MKTLEDLAAGQRRVADGRSGLPLEKVNLYRAKYGMDDLSELPPGVAVRLPNKKSHVISPPQTKKLATSGPGTELIRIYKDKGVPSCQACYDLAAKMDAWGIEGCKDRVEEIVDDCKGAEVAVFVKQLGTSWARENQARDSKGGNAAEWSTNLRVRQFPTKMNIAISA